MQNPTAPLSQRNSLAIEYPGRLTPLMGGQLGLRSGCTTQIRTPEDLSDDAPVIDFIVSTETVDRYGEVIKAAGWRLENYRRNPVFLNAHQYGDVLFTLGRALITEIRGNSLYQRVEFATAANPVARIAFGLYRGRFLNAVSVGFVPIRWENGGENSPWRRRHLEQELLEVSAVSIPANPEALQMALRAGAIRSADLGELLERLAALAIRGPAAARLPGADISESAVERFLKQFGSNAPADPVNRANAWLQLARAARQVLSRD